MSKTVSVAALTERPTWFREQIKHMRYPLPWEAARTTWNREHSKLPPVRRVLTDHVNHMLSNRYRAIVLQNGLIIIGVQSFWYQIVVAAALIISIYLDSRRRSGHRRG